METVILETKSCGWCGHDDCGELHEYHNNNYSGKFCDSCVELVDLASDAVDNDNS